MSSAGTTPSAGAAPLPGGTSRTSTSWSKSTTAGIRSRPGWRWIRARATSSRSAAATTGARSSTPTGSSRASRPDRPGTLSPVSEHHHHDHDHDHDHEHDHVHDEDLTDEQRERLEEREREYIRRRALAQIRQYPDAALRM